MVHEYKCRHTQSNVGTAGSNDAASGGGLDGRLVGGLAGTDVVALLAAGGRGSSVQQALASALGNDGRVNLGGDDSGQGSKSIRVLHFGNRVDCWWIVCVRW